MKCELAIDTIVNIDKAISVASLLRNFKVEQKSIETQANGI